MIEDAPVKELERLLAKVDILEPLPPEQVERLAALSSSMRLEAGEAIALDEDRETLLLLASGWVRVHEPSAAGPELTISLVEDGTVVGQTGFAARLSRALRVEALEPFDGAEVTLERPRRRVGPQLDVRGDAQQQLVPSEQDAPLLLVQHEVEI